MKKQKTIDEIVEELQNEGYEESDIRGWKKILETFGNENNTYLLVAERYDRGGGPTYKVKFEAPNDYVALLCMACHCEPTIDEIIDYFGDVEDLLDENPTYKDLLSYMSSYYWGDGDDFIICVENITKDKTLYSCD